MRIGMGMASPPPLPSARPVKRRRKQLSCDSCRASKLKCDRDTPICSTCREHDRTPDQCTRKGIPVSQAPDVPPLSSSNANRSGTSTSNMKQSSHSPPNVSAPLPRFTPSPDTMVATYSSTRPSFSLPEQPSTAPPSSSHSADFGGPPEHADRIPSIPSTSITSRPPAPAAAPEPPYTIDYTRNLTLAASQLACRARKLLPNRLTQMEAILDLYWNKIAVVSPSYDPGLMLQRARELYFLPLGEEPVQVSNMTGMTLPMLAWLCAACSSVLRLAQPTRLLIWGIVDDAAVVAQRACELNTMARECLRVACSQGEKAMCPMRGCPSALLRIQAAIAIASSASCGAPPPGCSGVLDVAIRYARQAGLDRLGKISERPRTFSEYEKASCWLSLVCADWRAAPYLGCYTIFPNTYTTEWDLSLEQLTEAHAQLAQPASPSGATSSPEAETSPGPSEFKDGGPAAGPEERKAKSPTAPDAHHHGEAPSEPTPPIGSVDNHAAMWVWTWQIRIADEARKLCDLGVHDAAQRVNVSYDKVVDRDRSLQQLLESRPPELTVEGKKENRDPETKAKVKRFPWLLMQAVAVTVPLRTILLSLHMPYVLGGYHDEMNQPSSGQALSIASALEQSVRIVRAAQRASMKGIILHRQWPLRHSLFNAGLLLIFDLLLRNSSLLPPVYPGGAFGEHSLDEEVALAIECLDDSSWRRGRSEVADVPWVDNSDFPLQWLPTAPAGSGGNIPHLTTVGAQHFTGERLERLLVLALRRNGQQGDGALAVDSYMQAYTTDMIGYRRSVGRNTASKGHILPASVRSSRKGNSLPPHAEESRSTQPNTTTTPRPTPTTGLNVNTAPRSPNGAVRSSPMSNDYAVPTYRSPPSSAPTNLPTGLYGLNNPSTPSALRPPSSSATQLQPPSTLAPVAPIPGAPPNNLFGLGTMMDANYLEELLHFADSSTGLPVDAILNDPFLLNMTTPQPFPQ